MYAPPPIQLTRAQIEKLKQEAATRQAAKRASTESKDSSEQKPRSIPNSPNGGTPRKGRLGLGGMRKVSKPITAPPTSALPPPARRPGAEERDTVKRPSQPDVEKTSTAVTSPSHPGVRAERRAGSPRKAPVPPRRPPRPSSPLFTPSVLGSFPLSDGPSDLTPERSPPPVPEKSPRRQDSSTQLSQQVQPSPGPAASQEVVLRRSIVQLSIQDAHSGVEDVRSPEVLHSSKAGVVISAANGKLSPKPAKKLAFTEPASKSEHVNHRPAVQSGKVEKIPRKRASAADALEATLLELEYPGLQSQPRRATESSSKAASVLSPAAPFAEAHIPWKRRAKGETMSMLLDAGFFPLDSSSVRKRAFANLHVKPPPPSPSPYLDKELPDTPDSIAATPTEVYPGEKQRVLPPIPKVRKTVKPRRSPLAPVVTTSGRANGSAGPLVDPTVRLSSIPESMSVTENSPPPSASSGVTTLVATQLHLKGGSVLTVTPPELTAWERHVYIQGAIRLPKPAIMPRKNSIASLEPFQDVIEHVYQHALHVPRRRSDDAVVEDICEWFDAFGFEDIAYRGDVRMLDYNDIGEVDDLGNVIGPTDKGYSTPSSEPTASPLQKGMAREVVAALKSPMPPQPPIPPVETEETLRARGIARLSQGSRGSTSSRKESLTLGKAEAIASFTPLPEISMLVPASPTVPLASAASIARKMSGNQGGMEWADDIAEIDEHSAWVASAFIRRHPVHKRVPSKESRGPVGSMRWLMSAV
ncbi:hypothetical protein BAUCODRAFT_37092 [Baudoinia panamericana UAMH 10762]|uniref:Uncharacterized protein n=1 Tax=Baudoinia panamericana (strain UAMH 10762) TaxID=717646 RepID=M2MPN6_BAUPA|nr:uncharacterized protein BAUCODRAFT_37092 [Baudoinia panamericana UAMH 10762]EMC93408.1 hypothetical protein BAUCODRAFT_37092 [Baudoinia panamericana UAMH 10762]